MTSHLPLIVVGSGPAGLTAALYAARARLNPLVVRGPLPGGLVTTTEQIDNFPGFPDGISGFDLAMQMEKQAEKHGTRYLNAYVTQADLSVRPYRLSTDDGQTFTCDALIIATGSTPRMLGVPGELEFQNAGVEHCATCDGPLYAGQTVVVVGGGNTALTDALQLSRYAETVLLIHRSGTFRAEQVLQEHVKATPNIHILYHTRILEILGADQVEGIVIEHLSTGRKERLETSGVFVCIGSLPNTQLFAGQLDLTSSGHIATDPRKRTSKPDIYAVGDVTDSPYRQAIISAAEGAQAALEIIHTLKLHKETTP
ncbi:NAD(P)/FAD-dependent oxidoreductase [Deinococcus cellulosilyticus]|uniref:Thioredoxin reductase n=1 Tax=Deinococcus cellulosilyticus (strain DSM 18568 / NBRC 106333 / KACC 11606 / 5516J-15) TaxID=1223518 RepID=A0A511N8B9_DEIC1|nr:FAD-dependent oxidoreductase [Deinococcus cellulosilyticus]GEM49083.1 thioredoxin reductase [Deinococcus cellulosilyticus NBRC 106333 = KACC 11606]